MRTIILSHPLPRHEGKRKRYLINGKRFDTIEILELLKKSGFEITTILEPIHKIPSSFAGIPIKSKDYGTIVYPCKPEQYAELFTKLNDEGLVYHQCQLPN